MEWKGGMAELCGCSLYHPPSHLKRLTLLTLFLNTTPPTLLRNSTVHVQRSFLGETSASR